jgi:hypothetical protein
LTHWINYGAIQTIHHDFRTFGSKNRRPNETTKAQTLH